jgi:hypothetical protein
VTSEITRVEKPWGYELHWAKTDRYVGKLIHVNAGHALSLQYHNQKDETIYLHTGKLPSHDGNRGQRHLRGVDAGAARRRADRRSVRAGRQPAVI